MTTEATYRPNPPHPLAQLGRLIEQQALHFRMKSPRGYRRGVEFYPAFALPRVLAIAANQFRNHHGRFPDIVSPERYTDKIFWSKFFRPLKCPESGNKLLTSSFIPQSARSLVQCPTIVWHSPEARIPRGDEIEPGDYYLKANTGANRFRRVTYPMSDAEAGAIDAEFEPHLRGYNWWRGEWWYNAFPRELLLERAVGTSRHTTAWNVLVIAGEVAMLIVYQKLDGDEYRRTHLSPDFEPLDISTPAHAVYELPSEATRERMLAAAREIGAPLRFVRVDFLLDDEESFYLGEVTFAPGNGLTALPDELDLKLGAMWDLRGELEALVPMA